MPATRFRIGLEDNSPMQTVRSRLSDRLAEPLTMAVVAGLVLGLIGLALAYMARIAIPGRLLGDPLPLALLPGAIGYLILAAW